MKRRSPLRESLHTFWPRGGHKYPIMFCNIVGEEDMKDEKIYKRGVDTHSKSNHQEAEKTVSRNCNSVYNFYDYHFFIFITA